MQCTSSLHLPFLAKPSFLAPVKEVVPAASWPVVVVAVDADVAERDIPVFRPVHIVTCCCCYCCSSYLKVLLLKLVVSKTRVPGIPYIVATAEHKPDRHMCDHRAGPPEAGP